MLPDDPRHGTTAGYSAHRKKGVPLCDPCAEAQNAHRRAKALLRSKACPQCGQPCRHTSTVCRACNNKRATEWAALARAAQREKRAERLRQYETGCYPEDEIRYDGGWVRRGLVMVPANAEPRRAPAPQHPLQDEPQGRSCRSCKCHLISNSIWRTMSQQERADGRSKGSTRHYARSLCGPCYRKAGEDETLLDHELIRLPKATLLSEVAHHAGDNPGLSQYRRAEIAAQRLGMTVGAVERALVRANREAS